MKDYTKSSLYKLKDEQQEGVQFLLSRLRAILVFQTGLGKTHTVVTAFRHLYEARDDVRGVIICPVNAISIFKKDLLGVGFKKNEIGSIYRDNVSYNIDKSKVILISYSYLPNYCGVIEEISRKYKVVAMVDEVHKLCASKTDTRKLFEDMRRYFSVIWGTTATPILNDEEGLYNLISYFDHTLFGNKTKFYNNYVDFVLKDIFIKGGGGRRKKIREVRGFKNYDDLRNKIESVCLIRGIEYNVRFYYLGKDISSVEADLYEKASRGIIGDEKKDFGARMHDLQRVVDNVYEYESIEGDISKEDLLLETLEIVLSKDYSPLIYAEYHLTIDRLDELLKKNRKELNIRKIYHITGKTKAEDRRYIEANLKPRDIVLITSAGTQSLNLQKSNTVIFYDIPFPIGVCVQIIGRVTRMDSKFDSQHIFVLYTRNTIDEYKYLNFADNSQNILKLLGSATGLPEDAKNIDKKNLKALKEKYLWHYKSGHHKKARDMVKSLRSGIKCLDSSEVSFETPSMDYFIDVNLLKRHDGDRLKRIDKLVPPEEIIEVLRNGPKVVFRLQYLDFLRKSCKDVLLAMRNNVILGHDLVLVSDDGVGAVIKEGILDLTKI